MNKRILAFSLVELMISLIVISIVTAAFAPIVTKKLKTSDMSIGTTTATSITSSSLCNSVSKGCIECENDKCLACSEGYFLNGSSCTNCSSVSGCKTCDNATKCLTPECTEGYYYNSTTLNCSPCVSPCKTCTSATSCLSCNDNYYLNGSTCKNCPNHCRTCTNASVCTTCNDGYFLTNNKVCYQYICDNLLCYLNNQTFALNKSNVYLHLDIRLLSQFSDQV